MQFARENTKIASFVAYKQPDDIYGLLSNDDNPDEAVERLNELDDIAEEQGQDNEGLKTVETPAASSAGETLLDQGLYGRVVKEALTYVYNDETIERATPKPEPEPEPERQDKIKISCCKIS